MSDEFRDRNKNKPYDPKKSCWVPNANKVSELKVSVLLTCQSFVQAEGGYLEGLCENEMKVAQNDDENDNDSVNN